MRKNRSDGRMTEDRPDRSRRKRNRKINSIFVMFGCLLALVLAALYFRQNKKGCVS